MPTQGVRRSSAEWRSSLVYILGLTLVYLGQTLPRLTAVPRVIMDESWEACTGYALAYEGRLRNPVIHGRDGIDLAFVQPRVTQSVVLAAAYRALGFSLASGRLASAIVGLGAVLGVFYLMRTWLSPRAAALVALLFSVESQFFIVSRVVRPEVYVVCASVWTFALLARGTVKASLGKCVAAGVVGALGCYTHPNALLVAVLGVPLILYQIGFRRRALAALACYALGGLIGLAPFLAYVAHAHAEYGVSFIAQLGDNHTHVWDDSVAQVLLREKARWCGYFQPLHRGPWVMVVVASMVMAAIRRHPLQVWCVLLMVGHAVLMAALIRSGSPHYLVVLSPWLAALVVLGAIQLRSQAAAAESSAHGGGPLSVLAVAGIVVSLGVHLAGNVYVYRAYRNSDYDAVCRRIAKSIPDDGRVYGNLVFWTGLHQYPYLSSSNEDVLPTHLVIPTLSKQLKSFGPQYVIRESDPCWSLGGLGPRKQERASPARLTLWHTLQDEYEDSLVLRKGILLDSFSTRDYGTIEVYKLRMW